ncbi:MAG TPA: NHLP family bacteriocin export ABC transporter peptidase/permease/ATPase subunit [Verrucomicrobiota bacterium]|nr:NHLP family bacteriocin export ABC transporter peptidase/permease/ATPase subunit [Verrucomicrobiota bacterium]
MATADGTHSKPAPKVGGRVRTPTVLQMEAVECGAAALAIVLGYHGRLVPLEELRVACGVSRDGSKASNVIRAAAGFGLIGRGFSKEVDELRSFPLPCIVFWNFNHFVVLEGFGRKGVYLNDPAYGPRVVSPAEFGQGFTGVVLTFEPGPDFRRAGEKPSLWRALRSRLAGSESGLAFVMLAGLALVLPGLVVPTFSRVFVDDVLVGDREDWVRPLLIGIALTAVLRAGLVWLRQTFLMRLHAKLAVAMAGKFFWHVLRLPVEFFTQRYGGEIGGRVHINNQLAGLLSGQLAGNAVDLLLVFAYAVLMLWYDVPLTLVGIATAALNIAALRYFSRRRVDGSRRLRQEEGNLSGTSMSGLQMMETLKATGMESDFFARWSGYQTKVVNIQQQLTLYDQYLNIVPALLSALNTAVILVVGGLYIIEGRMTIGMLVAFQSLMASFTGPFNSLVSLGGVLQDVEGSMSRLDDVLRHRPDPQLANLQTAVPDGARPRRLAGSLELRGVTFGYSRLDPPLIEDLSLTIAPGQRIALVGGSGSGKSTVSRLVCGLYQPWSGQILLDGRPRGDYPRSTLTGSLALVDQDIFLFEGTVMENLTLWDNSVAEAEVVQASKDSCIHEDIAARPRGYDSRVAEAGGNFSGGQRQRLEIARALAGNPSVLVLDEATSALDPVTEKIIDDNLRRRGCTCLIVAHRLSTIRDCDEIIVLQRGKVMQRGTHEELTRTDGPYAHLIKSE